MVGDIGGEVGRLAGGTDQDVVLVLAQVLGAEPDCAFLLDHIGTVAQAAHGDVVGRFAVCAGGLAVEGRFALPMVEFDSEEGEVVADLVDHELQPALGEFAGRVFVAVQPAISRFVFELLGHIDHVGALVAAVGQGDFASELLLVAGEEGATEESDLGAGVVDVVLALDIEAGGVEQRGEGVAEHGSASVADLQGAGRISGDELDLDAMSSAEFDAAPLVARFDHGQQLGALPVGVEGDVDEAGSGYVDAGDWFGAQDALGDGFGDIHGRHAHGAGQSEGDVAGIVAVLAFFGSFDAEFDRRDRRQGVLGLRQLEGVADQFAYEVSRRACHVEVSLPFVRLTL